MSVSPATDDPIYWASVYRMTAVKWLELHTGRHRPDTR